jgi:hypothetical protein
LGEYVPVQRNEPAREAQAFAYSSHPAHKMPVFYGQDYRKVSIARHVDRLAADGQVF